MKVKMKVKIYLFRHSHAQDSRHPLNENISDPCWHPDNTQLSFLGTYQMNFLTIVALSGCQFCTPCRFPFYLRHGFRSESEDIEAKRVCGVTDPAIVLLIYNSVVIALKLFIFCMCRDKIGKENTQKMQKKMSIQL